MLKSCNTVDCPQRLTEREFQIVGPETLNARSRSFVVVRIDGCKETIV